MGKDYRQRIKKGQEVKLVYTHGKKKNAIANARNKAQLYAQAADVNVGNVVSINELNTRLPQPVYRHAEMDRAKMMASSVPVLRGEQDISTSVTVVYELKN